MYYVSISYNGGVSSVILIVYFDRSMIKLFYHWSVYLTQEYFIGLEFIIKDLPSVLILIIADRMLNDSLCYSYKYNWFVCRFIDKLYILFWTFLINLLLHEIFWITLNDYEIQPKVNVGELYLLMIMCEGEWADATVTLWVCVELGEIMWPPHFHHTIVTSQHQILPIPAHCHSLRRTKS